MVPDERCIAVYHEWKDEEVEGAFRVYRLQALGELHDSVHAWPCYSLTQMSQHTFLQRLPHISQLRSLHVPYMADHIMGNFEPKELVMSVADIITLRPEIQLCYVGISHKCFEIMETKPSEAPGLGNGLLNGNIGPVNLVNGHSSHTDQPPAEVDEATDEDEDTDDDDDDSMDDSQNGDTPTSHTHPDDAQSDDQHPGDEDSDDDSFVEPVVKNRLRLREILFYDDKVAIFKARHGRL